jgi:hypothetical protein
MCSVYLHSAAQVALTLAVTRIVGRLFSYIHQPQVSSSTAESHLAVLAQHPACRA